MNLLRTGAFALLLSTLAVSCGSDDGGPADTPSNPITNLAITTATSGDGTVVTVTPSSTGGTSYSVDFGTDASDDVIPTSGPAVEYDYPNTTATYTITVTASAAGLADVSTTKDVTITFEEPDPSMAIGRWVLLHDAGALAVGPAADNLSWWSNDIGAVTVRNCLFDDVYEFKEDGSFVNVLGDQTWLEPVFGVDPEACGTPVAPFDGTATATWEHDETAGTIVLTGKGAFLGLAKVANIELTSPADAVESITYSNVVISEDGNSLSVDLAYANAGGADGVNAYWQFKFAKEGSAGAMLDQTDSDGDGVIDANDTCPNEAGTEPNGCPPASAPTMGAADPTADAANVVSIFSDVYTTTANVEYNPGWGQATQYEQVDIEGNNVIKYSQLNYQGTTLDAVDIAAFGATHIHLDVWSQDIDKLKLSLINTADASGSTFEVAVDDIALTSGSWTSIDIPLADFIGLTASGAIDQIKYEAGGTATVTGTKTFYVDNIYLYK